MCGHDLVGLIGALIGSLSPGFGAVLPHRESLSSPGPLTSWRDERRYGLVLGFLTGLSGVVFGGLSGWFVASQNQAHGRHVNQLAFGLWLGLGLAAGIGIWVLLTGSRTWSSSCAFAQLAARRHTPLRLMRFLEDARERGVLRTVGPVYQFRHARL